MDNIDCDDSVMLICLTGYCMAKSDFDHTITQPPALFQLRKLEFSTISPDRGNMRQLST